MVVPHVPLAVCKSRSSSLCYRYRYELEKISIDSAAAFRRIIHSAQSLESIAP